jgi:hypothetical protein
MKVSGLVLSAGPGLIAARFSAVGRQPISPQLPLIDTILM